MFAEILEKNTKKLNFIVKYILLITGFRDKLFDAKKTSYTTITQTFILGYGY